MQTDTTLETCPLCRRPLDATTSGGPQDSTRLCLECKSIVQSVRPRSSNVVQTAQIRLPEQGYQQPSFDPQEAPVSFVVEESPRELPQTPASFEMDLGAVPLPNPRPAENKPASPTPNGNGAGPANGAGLDTNPLEPAAQSFHSGPIAPAGNSGPMTPVTPTSTPQVAPAAPELDASLDSLRASVEPPAAARVSAPLVPPAPENWGPAKQRHTDWPLVVAPPPKRQPSNLKYLLILPLILAVGAGGYFGLKWYSDRSQAKQPIVASQNPAPAGSQGATAPSASASPQASSPQASPPQASSPQASSGANANANVKRDAIPTHSGNDNSQGRFSLQAASFPNEAAANEYSEKLIRAGVASHVSPADLGSKGRWYRVKVGRFNTPEDANKFAAEAKQRAKSAGINLQLMPSEY
jgi:sporulation related protein